MLECECTVYLSIVGSCDDEFPGVELISNEVGGVFPLEDGGEVFVLERENKLLCICVCMRGVCVCICVCVHAWCVCVHACVHVCVYAWCVYVWCVCVHACVYAWCVCVHACVSVYVKETTVYEIQKLFQNLPRICPPNSESNIENLLTLTRTTCSCTRCRASFRGFPSDWAREMKFSVVSDWPAGRSNISMATTVAKASSRFQTTYPREKLIIMCMTNSGVCVRGGGGGGGSLAWLL